MTINLFFLTLTIQKRFKSPEEYEREYEIEQLYNEMKDRQLKYLYTNSQR
ncbi:YrzI family small protein [Bacillus glycinifermentans]|uniref:YrzI family small protein n=1 Tax=Bacillus glycinifermentans TaxID=1664069 RepID=A0ABU6H9E1_9BACI|nr:YrzI family small protein [Bacillus glycinifermentans]ATH92569.1 YrzI family small protein [Bacillus glycinifermentans]MEC0486953.1 YrzI family small protein [Bacillus glycinifermentans]MEC0493210.1 YrzI family small protein [Bacillus glycinifermentans]MEC0542508.1 YrzI family small protein [Bacillus glycinifermentans]MEC3605801.1 YrzI family small protein [Bacillus glycinifermentans]